MADQSFGYSREAMRYRDLSTGRWVSEREVRDAVDRLADLASRRMGEAAARYRAGQISINEFQSEMFSLIKESQIAAALAAYGGRSNMTPQLWGAAGAEIKRQYLYLRQFAADVLDGEQRQNGRLDARARQYGQAARASYENTRRRLGAEAGFAFEENHLHASESCNQCRAMTALGRVPTGTLIPIGSRTCRGSCRCTISRHRTMSEAA